MRTLIGLVVLAVPALSFAQSAPPPGSQPAPPPPPPAGSQQPYQPATGNPPYNAPPPASPNNGPYDPNAGTGPYAPPPPQGPPPQGPPPQGPYGQPQGPYGQPGPYGQQPYGQPYQPYGPQPYQPPPRPLRGGLTFEANLGVGWIKISDDYNSDTSDAGLGGICLGIGGWVGKNIAITARLAGVNFEENDTRYSAIFLGPSLQYWIDDHIWLGGGAGIGVFAASSSYGGEDNSISGFGLDLRAGYTFNAGSENTINASVEINPSFFNEDGQSGTATGIALLVGYQHL